MAGLLDDTSGFGGLLGNPLFNIGLATLAASAKPGATFGGAVGQGGLLGMQNLQQARQAQGIDELRKVQLAKAQREMAADAAFRQMLTGGAGAAAAVPGATIPTPPATRTALTNAFDPGVAGPARADTYSLTSQVSDNGIAAPPTSSDAPSNPLLAGVPPQMLPFIGQMGAKEGGAVLANYISKNAERGQFVPETRTINGISVDGQKDRLSGKWTPLDPSLTKLTVNNNIAPEQAGAVQSAKDLSEIGKKYYDLGTTAQREVRGLEMQKGLLASGTVETGFGAEAKMRASRALKAAGIDIDPNLGNTEFFQSLATQMQLGAAPQGQGQVSNYERSIFGNAVTNLGRTTEGNKKLVEWYLRIKKQDASIGRLYEQELEKNGRVTPAFLTKVRETYEKPLFSEDEMKEMQGMGGASAPKAGTPVAPNPGMVQDGYRFRGGNPADPNSWEKL